VLVSVMTDMCLHPQMEESRALLGQGAHWVRGELHEGVNRVRTELSYLGHTAMVATVGADSVHAHGADVGGHQSCSNSPAVALADASADRSTARGGDSGGRLRAAAGVLQRASRGELRCRTLEQQHTVQRIRRRLRVVLVVIAIATNTVAALWEK
jgi:hypothetical protein